MFQIERVPDPADTPESEKATTTAQEPQATTEESEPTE
jgi:hypothetical protein